MEYKWKETKIMKEILLNKQTAYILNINSLNSYVNKRLNYVNTVKLCFSMLNIGINISD
jgi:hypothetical protein